MFDLIGRLWPCLADEPVEQHPGNREFTDDDENAPPHFSDPTSHEPESDDALEAD